MKKPNENPLDIKCPYCGAEPGQPCVNTLTLIGRKMLTWHRSREQKRNEIGNHPSTPRIGE